jgi:phage tail-like protein
MDDPGFRYLNLANRWPDLRRDMAEGVAVYANGAIALAQLPATIESSEPWRALVALCAISVDADGSIYLPDLVGHQVLYRDICTAEYLPLPGTYPLAVPTAVLAGPRNALYIADSVRHTVLVIDRPTLQLRAVWGQPYPDGPWDASSEPGRFREPRGLAADSVGAIYVADYGNRRIQKLDAFGRPDATFAAAIAASWPDPNRLPTALAIVLLDDTEHLLVLANDGPPLLCGLSGTYDQAATDAWRALAAGPPAALVAAGNTLAVNFADGPLRGMALWMDGTGAITEMAAAHGPARGLCLDSRGRICIIPHAGMIDLAVGQSYARTGHVLIGPLSVADAPVAWQRLTLTSILRPESHLQLWATTTSDQNVPPTPNLAPGIWRAAPPNGCDLYIGDPPATYLWIYVELSGDGYTTPQIQQARVSFGQAGWIADLPALFRRDAQTQSFLQPALALFASVQADAEARIDDLPLLADPYTSAWPDWLAGWLGETLDHRMGDQAIRAGLAGAFRRNAIRGTAAHFVEMARIAADVTAWVEVPNQEAAPWFLGERSILGCETFLSSADPDGAVVGATATLNQSMVIDDPGASVSAFTQVLAPILVRVYAADLPDATAAERLQFILEAEAPATTTCLLERIGPALRLGLQARLGIDAIVAGAPAVITLGTAPGLTEGALAARGGALGGQIGIDTSVSRGTRVG